MHAPIPIGSPLHPRGIDLCFVRKSNGLGSLVEQRYDDKVKVVWEAVYAAKD